MTLLGFRFIKTGTATIRRGVKMIVRRNVVYSNQNIIPFIASNPDPAKRVITDGNGIIVDDSRNSQNDSLLGVNKGRNLLENNVVFENGARGLHVYPSDHVDIVNNTAYHNSSQPETPEGEVSSIDASDVRVFNNMLVPRADRVSITRVAANAVERATQIFEHNLVFDGLGFDANLSLNLVGVDPMLTNSAAQNFHPQTSSPAIDAGSSSLTAKDDIEAILRPLGTGIDLGAFEVR
jgi:parallel beta-helix repeat protein